MSNAFQFAPSLTEKIIKYKSCRKFRSLIFSKEKLKIYLPHVSKHFCQTWKQKSIHFHDILISFEHNSSKIQGCYIWSIYQIFPGNNVECWDKLPLFTSSTALPRFLAYNFRIFFHLPFSCILSVFSS